MLEQQVWNEFYSDPSRLRQLANAIRSGYATLAAEPEVAEEPDEEEFPEGKVAGAIYGDAQGDVMV